MYISYQHRPSVRPAVCKSQSTLKKCNINMGNYKKRSSDGLVKTSAVASTRHHNVQKNAFFAFSPTIFIYLNLFIYNLAPAVE